MLSVALVLPVALYSVVLLNRRLQSQAADAGTPSSYLEIYNILEYLKTTLYNVSITPISYQQIVYLG